MLEPVFRNIDVVLLKEAGCTIGVVSVTDSNVLASNQVITGV
jgi:hypothetical protein